MGRKDKEIKDIKIIEIIKTNNRVCFEFDDGKALIIDEPEEKIKALDIITGHYSSNTFAYRTNSVDNVTVIKIKIEDLTGKNSGYL